MIVAWSENYLRTSLTSAFSSIRASPPNVSQYLTEPAPPAPTPAPAPAPPVQSVPLRAAPQPTNPVNPTDRRREDNATATTTTNPSWQANLPEVVSSLFHSTLNFCSDRLGMDSHRYSRCQCST